MNKISYGANEIKEECHCELCSSGRAERQFALSQWDENQFILWDVEEASAFDKWLDTPKEKRVPADFPVVKFNEEESPYYDVQLSLNTAHTGKNLNVCVIGGGGMGKTYNYVLPNILQANTSYVITDRDGYLLNKTGKFLKEQGYIVKVLNLNDTEVCNEDTVTNMELNFIGDRKTAVFITLPTFNHNLNSLSSVLVTQIFNALYRRTESLPNNKLPVHVRFMLDEFPNSLYIPDIEKHMAVCVHKNISVNIILQCIEQLQTLYSNWEIILNNCDSLLFLGGRSVETLKRLSAFTGINVDKLFALNAYECVLNIRELPPIYSKKFDPEKHINYGKIEE